MKKIILHSNHPDYKPPVKKRMVAKPWIEPGWILDYRRERDRDLWRKANKEDRLKIEMFWKEKDGKIDK